MSDKFELEGDFTNQDMETILEALDDWELKDQELLQLIGKLKQIPDLPPGVEEEHRESFMNFKRHMLDQEESAKKNMKIRREKAILLKAKIILMNQRKAADEIFDEASRSHRNK